MGNHTGLSPNSPNKYLGDSVYLSQVVTRNREPTGADYRQPETGKLYPFNTFWLVGKNPTTGAFGDMWYLSKIVANVGYWVKLASSSGGPALMIGVPLGTSPILADANGLINFTSTGSTVAITGTAGGLGLQNINFDVVGSGDVLWTTIIASQALAAKRGYMCISPGGALSLSLPATASIGDTIEVVLDGSTSFVITQAAGQRIRLGSSETTLGATGTLTTTQQGDWIRLVAQSNTRWLAHAQSGNFLIV